jgi:pimeloyl-ACP methyl ester carboxylesterase
LNLNLNPNQSVGAKQKSESAKSFEHTVYLLRGLAREARHWGSFPQGLIDACRARGVAVRVVCIDLPGAGQHSEVIAPFTIESYAEFVDQQIELLEPSPLSSGRHARGPVHLVGMSLGGMVAIKLAEIRPSGFDSVVTINTSSVNAGRFSERLNPAAMLQILEIVATRDVRDREEKILKLVSNSAEARRATLESWVRIHETRPVAVWNLLLQLTAASRFQSPLQLSCPLLVIVSDQDRLVNPNCSARLADSLRARLVRHLSAGHDIAVDAGPWLADQLAEWGVEIEVRHQNHQAVR